LISREARRREERAKREGRRKKDPEGWMEQFKETEADIKRFRGSSADNQTYEEKPGTANADTSTTNIDE
jgi:hypothetical protein